MSNNIYTITLIIIISFLVSAFNLSIIDYDPMQRSTSNTTVVHTTTSQTNSYSQYYSSYYQGYDYYPYYYDYYCGYYYPYYY